MNTTDHHNLNGTKQANSIDDPEDSDNSDNSGGIRVVVKEATRNPPQNLADLSDNELMQAVQNGSKQAFAVIYERYLPLVRNYIAQRLSGKLESETDDAVQTVFLRLYAGGTKLEGVHIHSVTGFLLGRAQQVAIDYLRQLTCPKRDCRRSRTLFGVRNIHPPGQSDQINPVPMPYDQLLDIRGAEKEAARQNVADYLTQLTPAESQIVELINLQGHTAKSAAKILGISVTTATWRHRKAIQHLRRIAARESAA